jgi:Ca2+-binding RTX toxin-like protein
MAIIAGTFGNDRLVGTDGDDFINPRDNDGGFDGYDEIVASAGDDRITFQDVSDGWVSLLYTDLSSPINALLDGVSGSGTITKGVLGTDTYENVNNVFDAGWTTGGLGLYATAYDDRINIMTDDQQWLMVSGGDGQDSYLIQGDGLVRLDFKSAFTSGLIADLATGVISNDGYGNSETITGQIWEVRATSLNDRIVGSEENESFILMSGNDTLDGGAGFDRIRYDRSGVENGINADLAEGVITGVWSGQNFQHFVDSIERVRGSDGDDIIIGDEFDNRLEGNAGNDSIYGGQGDDTLYGGDGDDRLFGGDGTDELVGGTGDDYINPGDNSDWDYIVAGAGSDTIDLSDLQIGYVHLSYDRLSSGVVANIDGVESLGDISKSSGESDTIISVENALYEGGLGVVGSNFSDHFDVLLAEGQWAQIRAGDGVDSYSIEGEGEIRLDFLNGVEGINVDLSSRIIYNDGFGNFETYLGDFDQVRGTHYDDMIVGSSTKNYEYFILRGGNDTLDGGGLFDTVSYDREDNIQNLDVDLSQGLATGIWDGLAFKHQLRNIEEIFGSSNNDMISGSENSDFLDGRAGNDTISGGTGNDVLTGGGGADLFVFQGSLSGDLGDNVISDFNPNEGDELIILDESGNEYESSNLNLQVTLDADGNGVVTGSVGSVKFEGWTASELASQLELEEEAPDPSADTFIVQRGIVGKGSGYDEYIFSKWMIDADAEITITDSDENALQFIDGLEISSSMIATNAVRLTLSNDAVVTVLDAASYDYIVGGNPLENQAGLSFTYETFVEDVLGADMPSGRQLSEGDAVTIDSNMFANVVEVTSGAPVEGTDAAEKFAITVNSTDGGQLVINNFDAEYDSVSLNGLTNAVADTLDELAGQNGFGGELIRVQDNPFSGSQFVNLGVDTSGEIISFELGGVTQDDLSAVAVSIA